MATNILKVPIARVACRGLVTQAAAFQQLDASSPSELQCTTLPNKVIVSSQDFCGNLSRISVTFRAGPRNETPKNSGCTHIIRSMAGFSTKHYTDFFILRNIQQSGSYFSCTGDHEITSFNIVGRRDKIDYIYGFLASAVSAPAFKPWQVTRNFPRLKYEINLLSKEVKTMELLHKAAFRTGLGNPLFMSEDQIGMHNSDMLREFYVNSFTSNRAVVVGVNVHHRDLVKFAESFTLCDLDPPAGNSTYFGGDVREEKASYFATVAIATEGVGLKEMKQSLTYGVLREALGSQPSIKWGGSPSPLYKQVSPICPSAGASCFNISYSDNGLFGVMISAPAQNAGAIVEAVWKLLRSGQVSDEEVQRGKTLLKMKLLDSASNTENLIDDVAGQLLINRVAVPVQVLAEAVDKITASEVQAAAKRVANGKFSLAGYGNLSEVPYLDQLK